MKKFFYLLMLALPCFMLSSCGDDDDVAENVPEDVAEEWAEVVNHVDQMTNGDLFDGTLHYKIISKDSPNRKAMVSGCEKEAVKVEIPALIEYNGVRYRVTSIGEDAFYEHSGLTNITIPNSMEIIGNNAFMGCRGLTSVTIPNSVKEIGVNAFNGCDLLTFVTIGNGVKSIGGCTFSGCDNLTSITIPNSVTSIGDCAFEGCSSLKSVTIPNSVTSIGGYAFTYCSGLTSVIVEKGNTKYDSRYNCNAIIETASNTLITGCMNTIIPNSVTSIGEGAFLGCYSLTSISFPYSVKSIGDYAFSGCESLTSITIPNNVTSIGDECFEYCSALTDVTCLAKNPPTIEDIFEHCNNLKTLHVLPGCKAAYEESRWINYFKNIVEDAKK